MEGSGISTNLETSIESLGYDRDVVAFQCLQMTQRNLGLARDLLERHPAVFTALAQELTERGVFCRLRRRRRVVKTRIGTIGGRRRHWNHCPSYRITSLAIPIPSSTGMMPGKV